MSRKPRNWERAVSILLLAPSILALAIFVYAFIGWTGYVSLTRWEGAAPDFTFAGLHSYQRLFLGQGTDAIRFHIDLRNMVGFTLFFLIACLSIGFVLAVLVDQRVRAESFFRSVFLFPMAVSFIVTGVAWRWILTPGDPAIGAVGINLLLEKIGLDSLKSLWFTDPTVKFITPDSPVGQILNQIGLGFLASSDVGYAMALTALVIAATWQLSGYTMALYLAGLRSIPDELREAARMDGANELQVYRHIVIPLLQPITLSAVIILGHISLKIYDLVVSMTGSGPGFATDVPALNMWRTTFDATLFAQGAAIAVILLFLVAVLIIPYLAYNTRAEAQR
ncbi:MAG: sugar ABC transporter permease [Chloroflexi bacterium]|nr:sugar ABC transporter permease [Chloroflexota bacterium]